MAVQSEFRWCLVLMLWLCSSCSENSDATWVREPGGRTGQELYLLNCASCHGEQGDLGVSGAKNLRASVLNPVAIQTIVRNGKNAMPAFKGIITEQSSYDSLVTYVISLRN
jgi:mono/diheme cytochrome c family protein